MANTIIGKVLQISSTETIPSKNGGNPFYKRTIVLDCSRYDQYTGQQFENYPQLEFSGNKCSDLDGFNQGDLVEVSFALSGRRYEKDGITKYFTSIVGFKIEHYQRGQQASPQPQQAPQAQVPNNPPVADFNQPQVDNDGLPF